MNKKLSRAEKNELTRRNLFDAAVKVVGRAGYRDASVSDITAQAHIAHGTFYNYFDSRQDILDHLLPNLGEDLLHFLGAQVGDTTFLEREEKSIRAYFQFIRNRPEFYRILMEAPVYSPESFDTHADNLVRNYRAALHRTKEKGFLQDYDEDEFEALALILLGARVYLSRQYCFRNGKATAVPERIVQTYMKLITDGLGGGAKAKSRYARASKAPAHAAPPYACESFDLADDGCAALYTLLQPCADLEPSAADFLLQQIVADFTRRATEQLLDGAAAVLSTTTHLSRHRPEASVRARCKLEHLSDMDGILHIRLAEEDDTRSFHTAACQVVFGLSSSR